MRMRNYDRGLEELALSLALDIEPHDPPKDMGERLFEKIESSGSLPAMAALPAAKTSKFAALWTKGVLTKGAVAASAVLLALYGSTLYENQQLKEQLAKKSAKTNSNVVAEVSPLGEVERTIPLTSSNGAAKGTAYIVNSPEGKHIEIFAKGIIKEKDSDVIQIWIKENGKIRTVGATEPAGDTVNFSAPIGDKLDGIAITREKNYDNVFDGVVLLSYGFPLSGSADPSQPTNIDVAQRTHRANPAPNAIAIRDIPARKEEAPAVPREVPHNKRSGGSGGGNKNGSPGGRGIQNDQGRNNLGNGNNGGKPINRDHPVNTPVNTPNNIIDVGLRGGNNQLHIVLNGLRIGR